VVIGGKYEPPAPNSAPNKLFVIGHTDGYAGEAGQGVDDAVVVDR